VSRALHTLYGMADTAWVGRLSAEALGAVSTCFFASWTIFAVGDTIVAGVTALVSQAVGAGRDDEAAASALTGGVLAIVLGGGMALLGGLGAHPLFRLLFDDPTIARMGGDYMLIFALLAPLFYLDFAAEAVFRACGDSRTPMLVLAVGSVLNIGLDPLLIYGPGPFPRLGVQGAAIATAIAQVVVVIIYGVLYVRRAYPLPFRISRAMQEFSLARARRIVNIGTPTALVGILFSVIYLFLARLTGAFGAGALAALGVVNRLESVNYLTASAVGLGVATLVGQNLGGGLPDRAETAAHRGASIISLTTGAFMVAFLLFPEWIARLFTDDPVAVREAVLFLRIVSVSQVMMGWELVYGQAFTGAGDTLPPMYVSVGTSILRVPMAWWLAGPVGLGPAGIWWTISLTGVLRGVWVALWFRRGGWKRKAIAFETPPPALHPPISAEGPEG
jgi:MATE family, multidrug efflux pump